MKNNAEVYQAIKNYNSVGNAFLPHTVTISLSQEHNIICKPLVKEGDKIAEGDVIAKKDLLSGKSSFIHSSVTGIVEKFVSCYSPNGKIEHAIQIKTGGKFTYLGSPAQENTLGNLSPLRIKTLINENGVVNTFDTEKPCNLGNQINNTLKNKNIVVRLFDEDNTRLTDSLVSKFFIEQIIKASLALQKITEAQNIIFLIDKKIDSKVRSVFKDYSQIILFEMNLKKYPLGFVREIVNIFNKTQKQNIKLDVSDLYIDSSSLYDVYKAVYTNIPEVSKLIHFYGNCINCSCLLEVRLGTKISDIVKQLGGFIKDPSLIIINGRVCGTSVKSLDIPITKYIKSVSFESSRKVTDTQIYACINCGYCRFVCPEKISPDIIFNHQSKFDNLQKNIQESVKNCSNCHLCNSVCPSRLPLSQIITILRGKYEI